jgi:UDP-N-acetylglucosamine acyltransferase
VKIHPTAIIHPKASLAPDVEIGPFCVVGEHVMIGKGSRLLSHATIDGWTEIGERNEVHPFASIGGPPQHLGYKGERSKGILMAYVHVAHDCRLGDHIIMANAASLAGHITIGDHAVIGGLTGVLQFVRIGDYVMVGGCCAIGQDIPPFAFAAGGYRAHLYGLNSVGLQRHGFSVDRIALLKKAFDLLFRSGHRTAESIRLAKKEFKGQADVAKILTFMEGTKRGISRAVSPDLEREFDQPV